jgi:HEPN domain-containing protein
MIPHGKTSDANPAHWFYFAIERLKAADTIWESEGLSPSGLELLPEAVERLLKGYLISQGWQLVRTHDLLDLVKAAEFFEREEIDEMLHLIRPLMPQFSKELS